jgi:hypothetical protein
MMPLVLGSPVEGVRNSLKPARLPAVLEAQALASTVGPFELKAAWKRGERLVKRSVWA